MTLLSSFCCLKFHELNSTRLSSFDCLNLTLLSSFVNWTFLIIRDWIRKDIAICCATNLKNKRERERETFHQDFAAPSVYPCAIVAVGLISKVVTPSLCYIPIQRERERMRESRLLPQEIPETEKLKERNWETEREKLRNSTPAEGRLSRTRRTRLEKEQDCLNSLEFLLSSFENFTVSIRLHCLHLELLRSQFDCLNSTRLS